MKPYISQLLGEASKQAEILAGDKAKVARQQRMQRMQPQRPANQVFPIYLNNLFQGRDPGKEKLADEDDITEYEQRLEDIRQAKKDAKDFGYADPYPDTEELATKGTPEMAGVDVAGKQFPFTLAANTPDMEPAPIPGPKPQLGATFDEDPEIGMYRYNYIEKDGYCRPLNDPSGLEHTDGITGFNASGAVTPKKPQNKTPWYFQAPKTELEPDTRSHWVYMINSSDNGLMRSANYVASAEQSFWRTRESAIVGIDAQSLGPETMFVLRGEARKRFRLRGQPGDCKLVLGASSFQTSPKKPKLKLWKNPVGMKLESKYRLNQHRLNVALAAVLGKDPTGWKNVLGANATYTIKPPRRNGGEASPITVTGTLMHTKNKNALGGDVQFSSRVGREKYHTLLTSKLNLNSQGSGNLNVRVTGDSPRMALAGMVPLIVGSLFNRGEE